MYPEFIAIYVGLGVLLVLLIVIIIMLGILLKRSGTSTYGASTQVRNTQNAGNGGQIVFCRKCAEQFDASLRNCPKCGTPR